MPREIVIALLAAKPDVHAERWQCIGIRPGQLLTPPWSGLPPVRRSLDNARRAVDRVGVRPERPRHLRAAQAPPAQSVARYPDYVPGSNGPGSEKPSIVSTFA